ncbi:MAG: phosphopantetheine-binding protein [Pseudomonadota bacterium]
MPDDVGQQESTLDRLRTLIAEELDVPLSAEQIEADTPLFNGGLNLDSFAVVELVTLLEDHFDFEFIEDDLKPDSFVDVRTLAGVIERSLEQS